MKLRQRLADVFHGPADFDRMVKDLYAKPTENQLKRFRSGIHRLPTELQLAAEMVEVMFRHTLSSLRDDLGLKGETLDNVARENLSACSRVMLRLRDALVEELNKADTAA